MRTSAYPSEERWVPLESRADTLADETSGRVPNECAFRVGWMRVQAGPDAWRTNEAEAERLGGKGRLVGPS